MPVGLCRGGTSKADWKNLFKSVHPMPTGNKALAQTCLSAEGRGLQADLVLPDL